MRKWTAEQRSAIEAEGKKGDILVAAAAGSGKTSVLTTRVIRKITEEGCDIDRLLIVTFTRAAAAEMRERIENALSELLSVKPFDKNLLRQRLLLKRAKICTIDSFCTEILRENFQNLGIGRDFRIIEENEYSLIVSQIADELLEEYYGGDKTGDFGAVADFFLTDKSDTQLKNIIIKLNSFLSSHAFPELWLENAEDEINDTGDINLDIWGKTAVEICRVDAEFAYYISQYACLISELSEETAEKYTPVLKEDAEQLKALFELSLYADYEQVAKFIDTIEFGRLGTVKNAELSWLKDRISDYRKKYKDIITKLRDGIFCFDKNTYLNDRQALRPVSLTLLNITRDLDNRLFKRKVEDNFLSFSDLGRLCVKVLTDYGKDGFKISAAAKTYAARFDEILIDEYQDTNEVQDMIFAAISQNNRFMVGDVKQSIYAFRDADPTVFAQKQDTFYAYNKSDFPAKIMLNANFRSRSGICDFVNFIFSQTMSKELGGIEYGEGEALNTKAEYPENGETCVEIDLIDADGDTVQNEAEFIADRIERLIKNGYLISDGKGGMRAVEYGDIAVLYRSLSSKKASIMRAFSNRNIKISMEASGGLFSTYEIMSVMEILKAIDNPRRDLSLASAMMSAAFGFSEDEMANIRVAAGNRPCFYDAVRKCAETDMKVKAFLEELSELRTAAARYTVDEFLVHLYMKTGIKDYMRASHGGELRAANLELLITHAKNFEETGKTGLPAFLRYIDKIRENGGDSAMSSLCSGENDTVRIMTIHKSKGLEFPVVFLAGLGGGFNLMDANSSALLHKKLFFGSKIKQGELIRDTLPHAVLHRIIATEQVSEELRVLYVAMTRASEKLILTAAKENIKDSIKKSAELCLSEQTVKAYSKSVNSMLGWVIASVLRHPDAKSLRELLDADVITAETDSRIEFNIIEEISRKEEKEEKEMTENREKPQFSADDFAKIEERFNWQYPYFAESGVPTKMSVTSLSHEIQATLPRPRFITSKTELTAAEKGTATHLFMSICDLSCNTKEKLTEELNRLTHKRFLTKKQAEAVDIQAALAFLQSDIGKIAANADKEGKAFKEYGFEYALDAKEVSETYPENAKILISGTADLIICDGNKTYIVDYKTDKVEREEELISRYEKQLRLYEKALLPHFGGEIEKIIYSFALKKTIKLK